MKRSAGLCGFLSLSAVVLSVLVLMGATASSAQAGVSVRVIQVRASNEGEEFMDPDLGDQADALKKFPYKSFTKVGADTKGGDVNDTLEYGLANGSTLKVTIIALAEKVVTLQVVVDKLMNTRLRVRSGRTVMISMPWGQDVLILAITPSD